MLLRLLVMRCFSLGWLIAATQTLTAEEPASTKAPENSASIQEQLDELRAGQQRLLNELEQIKAMLQERAGRTNGLNRPGAPNVATANVHGEPFRGTNTARVAIIEYSDFDCTFCGRYARDVFPRVDADYVRSGKVKYYFRDLPEANDTNAWFKARAARCAGDQGKFWEMHDLLFLTQDAKGPDVMALGSTLGLNMPEFNECLAKEKYLINIQRSAAGAKRMGLYGTPAFLIGPLTEDGDFVRVKKVQVGVESYDSLKEILEEMLKAAEPKQ